MKDKILMLIIGVLLGAIITAGVFMLFGNQRKPNMPEDGDFRRWKKRKYDTARYAYGYAN